MNAALRLAVVCVLLVGAVSSPVAAAGPTSPCFPGEGHRFDVGGNGAGIDLVVFTSLFENLGGAGGLGMEASGTIGETPIIRLRTGVAFDGVGPVTEFLSNPFARFSVVYDYSLDLPMFADHGVDASYRSDGSPVSGLSTKDC